MRKYQAVASAFLLSLPALSTIVPRLTFDDLVDGSVQVVHGRVVAVTAGWDQNKRFLWTHYQVQVEEIWKGEHAKLITVSEPGGAYAGRTMRVPGAPVYAIGDEVVVFLEQTPIGFRRTAGWGQGKFLVERGPNRGPQVQPSMGDITLVDLADRGEAVHSTTQPQTVTGRMPLEDLKSRVRQRLDRGIGVRR